MPYCTSDDVEIEAGGPDGLVQLADHDGDQAADTAVVERAIARADQLIDSYLAKQFSVPVTEPASALATLVTVSAEIAVYFMKRWRRCITDEDTKMHETRLKWLGEVRDGITLLGSDPVPPKAAIRLDASVPRAEIYDVSRAKLRGFW